MKTINIPADITGVSRSFDIHVGSGFHDTLLTLRHIFLIKKNGSIRVPYDKPLKDYYTAMIDIESWQFNEEVSKFDWNNLTIENSTFILANYFFLKIDERLSFQPFLWSYLLNSNEWCSAFSNVILVFLLEQSRENDSLKKKCTIKQRLKIISCFEQLIDKFSSRTEPLSFESGISQEEEIENVIKIMRYWKEDV